MQHVSHDWFRLFLIGWENGISLLPTNERGNYVNYFNCQLKSALLILVIPQQIDSLGIGCNISNCTSVHLELKMSLHTVEYWNRQSYGAAPSGCLKKTPWWTQLRNRYSVTLINSVFPIDSFAFLYSKTTEIAFTTARIILHLISIPQFIYDLFHIHHYHSSLSREHMNPQLTCSQRQWLHSSVG